MKPHDYVLVVDDFADGREMVAEYLTFRGLSVVTASEGAEALRIARERPPAVVLMDLTMPGVDGWEATRRLKADPRTAESIVIALTAHALVRTRARGASRANGTSGDSSATTTLWYWRSPGSAQ